MRIKSVLLTLLVLCATILQVSTASAMSVQTETDHHASMSADTMVNMDHDCCDSNMETIQHNEECQSHCSFPLMLIEQLVLQASTSYPSIQLSHNANKPIPISSFILRPPKNLA